VWAGEEGGRRGRGRREVGDARAKERRRRRRRWCEGKKQQHEPDYHQQWGE
jgi:hypothetical protein